MGGVPNDTKFEPELGWLPEMNSLWKALRAANSGK
jgi:hypothetical protein